MNRNANKMKTHCPQGHPYSGDNLIVKKTGSRGCRQCRKDQEKNDVARAKSRETTRLYRKTETYRANAIKNVARYRAKYPEKIIAKRRLRSAIEAGKIVRPSQCGQCGKPGRVHGHHHDYTKPLEVKWLCALCHAWEHKGKEMGCTESRSTAR
jgi:hypothetical protein